MAEREGSDQSGTPGEEPPAGAAGPAREDWPQTGTAPRAPSAPGGELPGSAEPGGPSRLDSARSSAAAQADAARERVTEAQQATAQRAQELQAATRERVSGAQQATAERAQNFGATTRKRFLERPEIFVGGAFAGGLLLARALKWLSRG